MRTIYLIVISLLTVNYVLAQSKKDMELKINLLEEKVKSLENEVSNLKMNINLISKFNSNLEQQVNDQKLINEKLIKQNDSISLIKEMDFVKSPKNEEDSIICLFQSYYACKKWQDRLAYILKPEMTEPFMKSYYTDYKPTIFKREEISIQGSNFKTNQIFRVLVGDNDFYCKKTDKGYKIDWMASSGTNETPFKIFQVNNCKTATEFRVKALLYNLYDFSYKDAQDKYWSINIQTQGSLFMTGYILKSTLDGEKLYNILKDGKWHDLILELKFDSMNYSFFNVTINKIVQEGWSKE